MVTMEPLLSGETDTQHQPVVQSQQPAQPVINQPQPVQPIYAPQQPYSPPQPTGQVNKSPVKIIVITTLVVLIALGLIIAGVAHSRLAKTGPAAVHTTVVTVTQPVINTPKLTDNKKAVITDCYQYSIPTDFELQNPKADDGCYTSLNIAGGDALTQIRVNGKSGHKTIQEVTNSITKSLNDSGSTDIKTSNITINGHQGVRIDYKDNTLQLTYVYIEEKTPHFSYKSQDITGYEILMHTYNKFFEAILQNILGSIELK
jgi:hypothetical protein